MVEIEKKEKRKGGKKEFTAESGLGFLRVIQVVSVLMVLIELFCLLFLTGSKMPIDFLLFTIIVNLAGQSVVVWMISHRKIYTRQVAIAYQVFFYVISLIQTALAGSFNLTSAVTSAIVPALIILYFATSRRAKAVLVQPFDLKIRDKDLAEQTVMWNPRSLDFWLRLLLYFFVFSVVGHWMEMGVQILVVNGLFPGTIAGPKSLTWRDSLNPFFIYGIAVAFCGLVLFPIYVKLKQVMPSLWMAFVLSFLLNTLFCVVAELLLGYAFNADYHAWDYRDQFMNFDGQICLLYTIAFGVFSSVVTWLLYPFMEKQFSYISKDVFRVIFVISAVLFAMLFTLYNVDFVDLGIFTEEEANEVTNAARQSS